jgi:hypothetical protein
MSKPLSSAARAFLRKLRNPYATEQLDEETDESLRASESSSRSSGYAASNEPGKEKSDVWVLQDPYASLSEEPRRPQRALRAVARPKCSKAAFRTGCRRIFLHYTPAPERSSLREEHAAFILRNEDRSPEARHALLRELQRFDLSDVPGIDPILNRGKDAFTEEKLNTIERKVLGEK